MMAGFSHANIVQMIGFIEDLENGIAWIVLSWEPNGNISEFLASRNCEIPERVSLVRNHCDTMEIHRELTTCSFQIQDTFEGLRYLHDRQPPVCHGDLKSVG